MQHVRHLYLEGGVDEERPHFGEDLGGPVPPLPGLGALLVASLEQPGDSLAANGGGRGDAAVTAETHSAAMWTSAVQDRIRR